MIDYCVDKVETYIPGSVSYLDTGIFKISDYNSTVLPDGEYKVFYDSIEIGKTYGAYISIENVIINIQYDNYFPIYIFDTRRDNVCNYCKNYILTQEETIPSMIAYNPFSQQFSLHL